jgi:hypothetical protein
MGGTTASPVYDIDYGSMSYVGSASAPVRVVAVGDFFCPICRTFHNERVVPRIMGKYVNPGKVRLYFVAYRALGDASIRVQLIGRLLADHNPASYTKYCELAYQQQDALMGSDEEVEAIEELQLRSKREANPQKKQTLENEISTRTLIHTREEIRILWDMVQQSTTNVDILQKAYGLLDMIGKESERAQGDPSHTHVEMSSSGEIQRVFQALSKEIEDVEDFWDRQDFNSVPMLYVEGVPVKHPLRWAEVDGAISKMVRLKSNGNSDP